MVGGRFVAWLSLAAWASVGVLVAVWGYRQTVRYEDQGIPLTLIAGVLGLLVIEVVVLVGAAATGLMGSRRRWRGAAIAAHVALVVFSAAAWAVTQPTGWMARLLLTALTGT